MENWRKMCERKLRKLWLENKGERKNRFSHVLTEELQKLICEKRTNREISVWFEAVPQEHWEKQQENPLHTAATVDNEDLMKFLISIGLYNIDQPNTLSWSPLVVAIERGNTNLVRTLVEAGADYYSPIKGNTPLISAIKFAWPEIVDYLLDVGADVDARDSSGLRPLHLIVQQLGVEDLTQRLINMEANLNAVDNDKRTPLSYAILSNNLEAAKLLVAAGASVKFSEIPNFSPLHIAVMHKNYDMIDFLFQLDSDVDILKIKRDHHVDYVLAYKGLSCLQMSALMGDNNMVVKLLDNGASFETSNDRSVLSLAVMNVSEEDLGRVNALLKILLLRGAGSTLRSDEDYWIMCKCLEFMDEEVLRLFIAKGNIDLESYRKHFDKMVFYMGLNKRHGYSLLKFFLNSGKIKVQDRNFGRYASISCRSILKNVKFLKLFLKNGCDINHEEADSKVTWLEIACCKGSMEAVSLLLDYNADINKGSTLPLRVAIQSRDSPSYKLADNSMVDQTIFGLIRHIVVAETQGKAIDASNYRIINAATHLKAYYEACKNDCSTMSSVKINNSITYLDVFINPQKYYLNRYVVDAFEQPNIINTFGEYKNSLIERFEKFRKRPKLIKEAERGFLQIFKQNKILTYHVSPIVTKYLSNKDLRAVKLV